MAISYAHCKTKMVCEPDEPKKEGDSGLRKVMGLQIRFEGHILYSKLCRMYS